MFDTTRALYADLAHALGVPGLTPDNQGSLQIEVGENNAVAIFAEDPATILLATSVMALPPELDYGRALWLLRRNFYDSPIAPFRIACDTAGNIVVWSRVPTSELTGEQLAAIIDALAAEADTIREEAGIEP